MPDYLIPKSPFYDVELVGDEPGQAILTIPIPNDSLPYETLGVYAWDGTAWVHIPSTVLAGNDVIESRLEFVPPSFMVMQTTPAVPAVTADLGLQGTLPQGAVVTNEAKAGLYLRGDGALEGTAPVNSGNTLPIVRNWDGEVIRTDLINNLLIDPGLQENQVAAVEQTIVQNGYPGVIIDYRGVDAVPSSRADFVHLIAKLAERLHASNKTLAVRVESPRQISADTWDSQGYDWAGLGAVVDRLIVAAPVDPRAYQASGEMDALLNWATNQVERRKLQIEFPGQSVERSGNYLLLKGYQEALRPLLGQINAQGVGDGQQIALTLQNPRLLSQVTWDESLGLYWFNYLDDQGFERTVYLETAGSIAHKLKLLQRFNVRNVSLEAAASADMDPALWNVLLQFQQGGDLNGVPTQLSVVYTMYGQDGAMLAQEVRPVDNPQVVVNGNGSSLRVDVAVVNSAGQALGAPVTTQIDVAGSAQAAKAVEPPAVAAEAAPAGATDPAAAVAADPRVAEAYLGRKHRRPGRVAAGTGRGGPGGRHHPEQRSGRQSA